MQGFIIKMKPSYRGVHFLYELFCDHNKKFHLKTKKSLEIRTFFVSTNVDDYGGAEGNRLNQGVARSSPRQRRSSASHLDGFDSPRLNTVPNSKTTPEGGFIIWWSRGESNPCPKATWKELLRVQFVIYIPLLGREQTPCRV